MRVRELAEWLGATYEGDGERELSGVAPLESAGASDLAFVGTRKAEVQADSSAAGCLLVGTEWNNPGHRTVIRVALAATVAEASTGIRTPLIPDLSAGYRRAA